MPYVAGTNNFMLIKIHSFLFWAQVHGPAFFAIRYDQLSESLDNRTWTEMYFAIWNLVHKNISCYPLCCLSPSLPLKLERVLLQNPETQKKVEPQDGRSMDSWNNIENYLLHEWDINLNCIKLQGYDGCSLQALVPIHHLRPWVFWSLPNFPISVFIHYSFPFHTIFLPQWTTMIAQTHYFPLDFGSIEWCFSLLHLVVWLIFLHYIHHYLKHYVHNCLLSLFH